MYRSRRGELEVFLAHPGGPHFAKKDYGYWTIPKGELEPDEDPHSAALREFEEEVGMKVTAREFIPLGTIRQRGGKLVHAWGFAGDWETGRALNSLNFKLEWPPESGRFRSFPEVDRVAFFGLEEARERIKPTQSPFIDRLQAALSQ